MDGLKSLSDISAMEEVIDKKDEKKSKKKSKKKKEASGLLTPTNKEKEKSTLDISENEVPESSSRTPKERKKSASKHSKEEKHKKEPSDFLTIKEKSMESSEMLKEASVALSHTHKEKKKSGEKKKETPDSLPTTAKEKKKPSKKKKEEISLSVSSLKFSEGLKVSDILSPTHKQKRKSATKLSGEQREEVSKSFNLTSKEKEKHSKKKKEEISLSVSSLKFSEGLKVSDILSPTHKQKRKSATKLSGEQREEVSESFNLTSKEKEKHTDVSGKQKKDASVIFEALTSKVSEKQKAEAHDLSIEKDKSTSNVYEKQKKEPSDLFIEEAALTSFIFEKQKQEATDLSIEREKLTSDVSEKQKKEASNLLPVTSIEKKKSATKVSGKKKKEAASIEKEKSKTKISGKVNKETSEAAFEVSGELVKEPSDSLFHKIEKRKKSYSKHLVVSEDLKKDTSSFISGEKKSSKHLLVSEELKQDESTSKEKEEKDQKFSQELKKGESDASGEFNEKELDPLPLTSKEKEEKNHKVSGKEKKDSLPLTSKEEGKKVSGKLIKDGLYSLLHTSKGKEKTVQKVSEELKQDESTSKEKEEKNHKVSGKEKKDSLPLTSKEEEKKDQKVSGKFEKDEPDSLLLTSKEKEENSQKVSGKKKKDSLPLTSKEEGKKDQKVSGRFEKDEPDSLLLTSKEKEENNQKVSGKKKKDSLPLTSKEEEKKDQKVSGKFEKDEPDSLLLTSKEKEENNQKVSGKKKKDSLPLTEEKMDQKVPGKLIKDGLYSLLHTSKGKAKKVQKVSEELKTEASDSSLKSKEKKETSLKQSEFFGGYDASQVASHFPISTHSSYHKQKPSPCASPRPSPKTSESSFGESVSDSKPASYLGVTPISGSKFHESPPYLERDKGETKKEDSSDISEVDIYLSEETLFSSMGTRCRHFRYSMDMRSLQDASLEVGFDYYLRYSYKFFGCPYPVLVQPPVSLLFPGANLSFVRSYSSFDFGVVYKNFVQYVTDNPLTVEVWTVYPDDRDFISGLAQVPLHKVLYEKKMNQQDGTIQQMIMVQCPIFPPSSNLSTISTTVTSLVPKLATLHITLVLDDMGPIAEKIRPTIYSEEESVWKKKRKKNIDDDEMKDVKNDLSDHEVKDIVKRRDHEILDIMKKKDHKEMKMTSQIAHSINVRMRAGSAHQANNGGHGYDGVGGIIELSTNSVEYKVAMELDMCRASEERVFWGKRKKLEAYHMSHLSSKWQKEGDTDTHRQELYMRTIDPSTSLEKNLQDGIQQLQKWRRILKDREDKMAQEKEQHVKELKQINDQCEKSRRTAEAKYQLSLDIGRNRSRELQYQVDLLKKQANELEVKLHSRNNEFEKYQRNVVIPQSKLQGDLTIAQMEKEELEGKLASLSTSKDKYKKKWKETLSELVDCQHQEPVTTPTQDSELAEMHMIYREHDGAGSFNLQIGKIKREVKRLELQVSAPKSPYKTRPSPPHYSCSLTPSAVTNNKKDMIADVAKLIEQRDTFLQTGLYSSTDAKIQNLDYKIEAAISKINR